LATLFGREWPRAELLEVVGDVSQVASVQLCTLAEGAQRGVRVVDLATGSGFRFSVLLDRGMDIGPAWWGGYPLAWQSGAGAVHPAYYEGRGDGWLRSFPGGLMVGCGLDNVGSPNVDEGQELGVHGRLSHTPASLRGYGGEWQGDEYLMWVEGEMRQYKVFGANLSLRRRISTRLGSNTLRIEDRIANLGYQTTPVQILYHCNFGYPVVSAESELIVKTEKSWPRDEEAAQGMGEHTRFQAPTAGYAEQVFYHLPQEVDGYARAALVNQALGFGAFVRFRRTELPHLVEWKMMGQGTYVVGLEPANCWVEGRSRDRATGALPFLAPGEQISTAVEIGALPDRAAIEAFVAG